MTEHKKPWWMTDKYVGDQAVPPQFNTLVGPQGLALVRAWPDGRTSEGWGLRPPKGSAEGFMPRYKRGEFNPRRSLHGYEKGRWNFAFVMRALRLVCIDIDGKNGGLEHAKRLGILPPTLAETSRSGDGFHLFYTVEDTWDDEVGFAKLGDRIGLEQGVDVRATGCVYHYPQQRWNRRHPVPLPEHLYELLTARDQKIASSKERISKVLNSNDDMEVLMLHDELVSDLAKPIPTGKRNNTLFAIGTQLHEAQVPDWEDKLADRASELGLEDDESDKIIENIKRYSGVGAP